MIPVGTPSADDLYYPPDADFEEQVPSSLVMESNALDLIDLVQYLETDIDSQSSEISNGHSPLAVTLAMTASDIPLSDHPFQLSTQAFSSGAPDHPYSLATTDYSLAHGANSYFIGPSITSTSTQEYTATTALKVEGWFHCPVIGCAVLLKRRDALKNHLQWAHSESHERVVCPKHATQS